MSRRRGILRLLLLLSVLLSASTMGAQAAHLPASPALPADPSPAPADSSVLFVENAGQFAEGARFQVRGGDRTIWLAEDGIWITLLETPHPTRCTGCPAGRDSNSSDPLPLSQEGTWERGYEPRSLLNRSAEESEPRRGVNLKLTFPGANAHPRLEPFNRQETRVSYFTGNDPAQWHADVPVWGGVRYVELYPGIDLELTGEGGRMVQRLVTRAGAGLSQVRLQVDGADALTLEGDVLRLTTAPGEFSLPLLRVSEAGAVNATRATVVGAQVAAPFAPAPGERSPHATLGSTSDLLYATFLGGTGSDNCSAIALGSSGNAYVTGVTTSSDLPTTSGAFSTGPIANQDAFVVVLSPVGDTLEYATYIGGAGPDYGEDIAVDGSGTIYLAGYTRSADFPTTSGAFDSILGGGEDAFVLKLNPGGEGSDDLIYSTLLGGSGYEREVKMAVTGSGAVFLAGHTWTASGATQDFPTTIGAFDTASAGDDDAFVAQLSLDGNGQADLIYSTFLGGSAWETPYGVAVDAGGAVYAVGETFSPDFPTTPAAFDPTYEGTGTSECFVAKLSPAGNGVDDLVYSTFLGTGLADYATGIVADGGGAVYVTGYTNSTGFPTTEGAFARVLAGSFDGFVLKLEPDGNGANDLVYSTFLGGTYFDHPADIAINDKGEVYVTGYTESLDFPTTPGAFDEEHNGGDLDAFVAGLNPAGSALLYATYLGGGDGMDLGRGIVLDGDGNAMLTGRADSGDFPTTSGAFDTSQNGGSDAYVARLSMPVAVPAVLGGVNADGLVDSTDALIILTADAGLPTAQFCPMNCGDTNADGFVDSTDALIVLTYDAGLGVPFAVGTGACPADITQPAGCGP